MAEVHVPAGVTPRPGAVETQHLPVTTPQLWYRCSHFNFRGLFIHSEKLKSYPSDRPEQWLSIFFFFTETSISIILYYNPGYSY